MSPRRFIRHLVAPSCFKEAVPARAVAAAIARGIRAAAPEDLVVEMPLSDGGEGFVETLVATVGGHIDRVEVPGVLGAPVTAPVGWIPGKDRPTAVVAVSDVAGLSLIPASRRRVLVHHTEAVGILLLKAIALGAERVIVGCGDSGTCDGGSGLARALGVRLLDAQGDSLGAAPVELDQLDRVDLSGLDPRLGTCLIEVVSSQSTDFFGPSGTALRFGAQKGATPEEAAQLDTRLRAFAAVIARDVGIDLSAVPGAGASGGVAGALHVFAGAALRSRVEVVVDYHDLDAAMRAADVVWTGEGCLDHLTRLEKLPAVVAQRARQHGLPVFALVGQLGVEGQAVAAELFDAAVAISGGAESLEAAIARTEPNLERAAATLTADLHARRQTRGRGEDGE